MELKLNTRKTIYALIDDEDYELVKKHKWYLSGGRQDRRYIVSPLPNGKRINLHRYVMGEPDGIVDHKDHNVLNCMKSNLRVCSFAENIRNSRKLNTNSFSVYKGLTFNKDVGRWRAKIFSHGVTIELGYFNREVDAARAYNNAAQKYHGEFACLNEIDVIDYPSINLVRKRFELIYKQ